MKKTIRIAALLLLILVALTGCKTVDPPADDEPTVTPAPTVAPTKAEPTLEPTITPRVFASSIEEPAASATPMLIYPIDLKVNFTFEDFVSQKISASFKIPVGWQDISTSDDLYTVLFQEPSINTVTRIPVQSTLMISVQNMQSVQTEKNAEDELNRQIDALKAEYSGFRVTSVANSRLMGEMGRYVSFWLNYVYDENEPPVLMRGRLHVTPVDRKLYLIRTMHPADFNDEYDGIYREARNSFKAL